MKDIAFIFARGGSKGIKNKNILKFNNKPLIAHTIQGAIDSRLFDDVVVSTDDIQIAEISKSYGASVPFLRPNELANDDANELLSWKHAIENYNEKIDRFISLPCTSPLRKFSTVNRMIEKYNTMNCDLLLGVTRSNHIPNFNIVNLSETGKLNIYNSSDDKIFRRQDAPNCFNITTYAYISNPEYILSTKSLLDGDTYGYILSKNESIDIDDIYDFRFAEYMYLNEDKFDVDKK